MLSYRQYLEASSFDEPSRRVVEKGLTLNGVILQPGDVYYVNSHGELHREGLPAVERVNGKKAWLVNGQFHRMDGPVVDGVDVWMIHGRPLSKSSSLTDTFKWELLRANPESIKVIGKPSIDMQEYVIKTRPDLIGEIENLDPSLKTKYSHEVGVGNVDL